MRMKKFTLKRITFTLFAMVVLLAAAYAIVYAAELEYLVQTRPPPAGFGEGKSELLCPTDRPSCVSTINTDADFFSTPFHVQGEVAGMMARLKTAINTEPRVEIVFESETRLEVVFKSLLFRYRDDVTFLLDPQKKKIDFRSRSRVGYSDMGVNRERMARLRSALNH
jgi:uncharacterized protein (DUF1499 family)